MQNDFADPDGSLYVTGGEDVIPFINGHIAAARAAGALVVYTQDWHPPSTPHFEKDGGIWPVHCVGNSWGAELHPDLAASEMRIRKGTGGEDGYSGFTVRDPTSGVERETELQRLLQDHGIERVLIVGLATDYCVKETALDAARLGFITSLLTGGIRSVDLEPGDGSRAIATMAAAGVDIT